MYSTIPQFSKQELASNSTDSSDVAASNPRIERIDRLSKLLDECIRVPGTNFQIGWDTIIGLIPGVGDAVSAGVSAYLIHQAKQAGASKWLLARMIGNSTIDFVLGSVPLVGDAFDAVFKANRKNARLLKRHLERNQS